MGPGIRTGEYDFIPFMLYMPSLFEKFIARWLAANLPSGVRVDAQYRTTLNASAELEIRIDIVLKDAQSGENLAVLDTKYKDPKAPSIADVQQVAFYANEIGARSAYLIYPSRGSHETWVRNRDVTITTVVFDLERPIEEAGTAFMQDLSRSFAQVSGKPLFVH
jgi:5-methylcytosine-specific restriction enzyme subunit McrC